jgi:hypothetical protein
VRRLALVLVVGFLVGAAAPARAQTVPDPWSAVPLAFEPVEPPAPPDHKVASMATLAGLYGAFSVWAYYAWYYDFEGHGFHVGGDGWFGVNRYAGGSDKLGHGWANLALARGSSRLLRWGGWPKVPAALIAGGLAAAYFAFIEVKDGYYYEMSPGDLVFNTLGAALGTAMEIWPRFDELIDLHVEYWPSDEYRAIVRGEAEAEINTINIAEDYSGQTYLLALHLGAFPSLDRTRVSPYVDVVAGFRTDGYKPDPIVERERTQRLFLGVSLNLQGVFDRLLDGKPRALLHGVTEIANLPFTSIGVIDAERSP